MALPIMLLLAYQQVTRFEASNLYTHEYESYSTTNMAPPTSTGKQSRSYFIGKLMIDVGFN